MVALPRFVVTAPASGQGKTTVAVGIMAALTKRGMTVAAAKVGPDYIDPGYHALATGRPGRNLDPWLCDEEQIAPLLAHGFLSPHPADLAIIEGVMGLFDGRIGTDGFASTAHIAQLTSSPVVVVVDISSASRTIAATLLGLRHYDPSIQIVGAILNKAGSVRHSDEVRRSVEATGIPVIGVLPRDAGVSAPSRHLGLIPVAERDDAAARLAVLAEQTAQHIDLDALVSLASTAPDLDVAPWTPPTRSVDRTRVVAVAGGRAFTFRYSETDELLRAAGCEPVIFDPATDAQLPPGTAGLYLGGGFPEVHAGALSTNRPLREEIAAAVASGMPTIAECAGLLYLAESVDGHAFVGAVPGRAAMKPGLVLRYTQATTAVDSILGPAGTQVRAHEFHRTRMSPHAGPTSAWIVDDAPEGFALDPANTGRATVHASYLHLHWAGNPAIATSFAEAVHAYDRPTLSAATVSAATHAPAEPVDLDYHGDSEAADDLVDFAVNVRICEPPPWLADVVRETRGLAAYPNLAKAHSAVAARHDVSDTMVLLTSGSAEAFTLIARALTATRPLVIHPQFTEPESALLRAGRQPEHVILDATRGFAMRPDLVPPDSDLVFVGNPTNPTGVLHSRDVLHALRARGRVLVIDEAFMDAVPGEPESMIEATMNGLLVLRSLTKTWGIAGVRAGYVVGDPELIAQLRHQQPMWSVSTPAARAIEATSAPHAIAEANDGAVELLEWRTHFVAGLAQLGLDAVPGRAPFVLVLTPIGLREALRTKGFAVRCGGTFPGLGPTWIRIAIRPPAIADTLLEAMAAVLGDLQESSS